MPYATQWLLALFSFVALAHGQPLSSRPASLYVDEDDVDVVDVYGGSDGASPESSAGVVTATSPTGHQAKSTNYFDGLDDEDTPKEEMSDLINRMNKFSKRVDKAQKSTSEEAINARFFAGLDDDEDEDGPQDGKESLESQLQNAMQDLLNGKVPKNLAKLLETSQTQSEASVEQIDVDGGLDVPAAPKKEAVEFDPPAVITPYGAVAGSPDAEQDPIVLLSRFNFHNNVMSKRKDEVSHWMVRFCYDWYSPCERITPAYKELAWKTEKQLNYGNKDGLQTTVRFADIDCSTDKPLCNALGAESYPKVIHYHHGVKVGEWEGSSGDAKDVEEMNLWMDISVEINILKSSEYGGVSSKDTATSLPKDWDFGLVFSVLSLAVTLLGHSWLVRSRPNGVAENECSEPGKDVKKQKRVDAPGPSGLGSMLPEEWVTKASGMQLLEL